MEFKEFNRLAHLNRQRDLFTECFPENKGTTMASEAHYLWKFGSFPNKPNSYEYGAYLEKDIIGYYAALPYKYFVNGEPIANAGMVCDVMTGVKARGKGVFTRLGKFSTEDLATKELDFTTGYPIRPEVIPGHMKVGWEKPFSLPLYFKFLTTKTLFKSKRIEFLSPLIDFLLKAIFSFIGIFGSSKGETKSFKHTEIDQINGFDDFVKQWTSERPIALQKDSDFLKWRLSAPDKEYQVLVLYDNSKVVGYTVFCQTIKENVLSLAILDLCLLQGYQNKSSVLIRGISEFAESVGAEIIMAMLSQNIAKEYGIVREGFIRTPYKFWFIVKNLSKKFDRSFLNDKNNWHLTWLDSDNF